MLLGLFASVGCEQLTGPSLVPVATIIRDSSTLHGQQVVTEGDVTSSFGIGPLGILRLSDKGDIFVVPNKPPASSGARVRVRGTVCQLVAMDEHKVVLLIEKDEQTPQTGDECSLPMSFSALAQAFLKFAR